MPTDSSKADSSLPIGMRFPSKGIINKTPFVILVRKGNPKGHSRFCGSRKAGVEVDSSRSG